jgi:formylmethanofuran dehydrogenase subunit E
MIKLTVDRNDLNNMVERGIKLHGHAGPYLNLGIKMGLLALDILGVRGYFDLSTEAELNYHTPVSCLVDGLQISTGCTMGKGNIKVKDNPDIIRAFFKTTHKTLLITLKPEIHKLLDFKKKTCEDLGQQMLNMTDIELFDYEEYEKQDESNQNN